MRLRGHNRTLSLAPAAAFLGGGIRRWIQDRVAPEVVRYLAVSLLLVLGILSVLEILFEN